MAPSKRAILPATAWRQFPPNAQILSAGDEGHSFFLLGGLAFPPFRLYGLLYQAGGAVALWPVGIDPYLVLAAVTAAANLWLAWAVHRSRGT